MLEPINKSFLLGVGGQKCGTTWLHDYLERHPQAQMGFRKEYHVFDVLYGPESGRRLNRFKRRTEDAGSKSAPADKKGGKGGKDGKGGKRARFINEPESYFSYFSELVKRKADTLLTGDITPSYAALPVEAFEFIKQGILAQGLKPKVVFLMRDPVERCVSAMRMELRERGDWPPTAEQENTALRDRLQSQNFNLRTRYDLTIDTLEQVFEPSSLHYVFYEELFTRERIEAITAFLEIPFVEPDFSVETNVSRTSNPIDETLRAEAYSHYRAVYEFAERRFGAERVGQLWKNHARFKQDIPAVPVG